MKRGPIEAIELAMVKQYRKRVSRRVYAETGGVVRYGVFEGLKLENGSHISDGPLAMKVLGLYETELTEAITQRRFETIVNMGGGDGYFSVGFLHAGLAERSVTFELDPKGRETIERNARSNGVADRITILGPAGPDFAQQVLAQGIDPAQTLIVCDIEGAEFDLLTAETVEKLADATWGIELHSKPGSKEERQLEAAFAPTHQTRIIKATPRQWAGMPEIEALRDYDRALVTCEGRKGLGTWLVAEPRSSH